MNFKIKPFSFGTTIGGKTIGVDEHTTGEFVSKLAHGAFNGGVMLSTREGTSVFVHPVNCIEILYNLVGSINTEKEIYVSTKS